MSEVTQAVADSLASPAAVVAHRFAFHPLENKLTDEVGMTVQVVQMAKDSGIASRRVRINEYSPAEVAAYIVAKPQSAIAEAVQEALYSELRAKVLKPMVLNGAGSISSADCSLDALEIALSGSRVVRLTKELITSVYDNCLAVVVAALVAEAKKLEECTQEEILAVAGPTIAAIRAQYLMLAVKDAILLPEQTMKLRRVLNKAVEGEMISVSGESTSADVFLRALDAIDARVSANQASVVEF